MTRKVVTTSVVEKMFCLVAITYTSPKVSAVPRIRLVSNIRVYLSNNLQQVTLPSFGMMCLNCELSVQIHS